MNIRNRLIDSLHPTFVVAEISANHNQSLELAKKLVIQAKECGCDAVKFQTYLPEHITIDPELTKLYKRAYMPLEWHKPLFELSYKVGIIPFCSVFSPEMVGFLEDLDCPVYKIASFEFNHFPLLSAVQKTGKPAIISTGMCNFNDLNWLTGVGGAYYGRNAMNTVLLHCVSKYPAKPKDYNLRNIEEMRREFGFEVGVSDHTRGFGVSIGAVAKGAVMIERHFTLKRDGGIDDDVSLEPDEMDLLVREVKSIQGSFEAVDWSISGEQRYKRSIYCIKDIKSGDEFNEENIALLRPSKGINAKAWFSFMKGRASMDIKRGEPIHMRHLK
jgi:sialic acid synthase SpsE